MPSKFLKKAKEVVKVVKEEIVQPADKHVTRKVIQPVIDDLREKEKFLERGREEQKREDDSQIKGAQAQAETAKIEANELRLKAQAIYRYRDVVKALVTKREFPDHPGVLIAQKNIPSLEARQMAARYETDFSPLGMGIRREIRVSVEQYEGNERGACEAMFYSHSQMIKNDVEKIAFYIPGTASVAINFDVDKVIATHLQSALNMPVVLTSHPLAPGAKMPLPLNGVCEAVEQICKNECNNPTVTLVGYSSGGWLATLAALALRGKVNVERLILFAPWLDITGELTDGRYEDYAVHLPHRLRDKQKFEVLQSLAKKDIAMKHNPTTAIVGDAFGQSVGLLELRQSSPSWMSAENLAYLKESIRVDFILGAEDRFRMDAEIFHGILQEAGISTKMILLEGEQHYVMWKQLYPVYLAQEKNNVIAEVVDGKCEVNSDTIEGLKKDCERFKKQEALKESVPRVADEEKVGAVPAMPSETKDESEAATTAAEPQAEVLKLKAENDQLQVRNDQLQAENDQLRAVILAAREKGLPGFDDILANSGIALPPMAGMATLLSQTGMGGIITPTPAKMVIALDSNKPAPDAPESTVSSGSSSSVSSSSDVSPSNSKIFF